MNSLSYILRFLKRISGWIILVPLFITILVIWLTRDLSKTYESEMTVFTGVVSDNGAESEKLEKGSEDWNIVNNTIQNIINVIISKETLKDVSMHLYARCMIHGNPNTDNIYISAEHYRQLVEITPKEILRLIDKTSEEKTVSNLDAYYKPDRNNFVYGLFNWYHPYFSYNYLKTIQVKQIQGSDILEISYSNNDPGIVYQTLDILAKAYVKEYKALQFGTTNNAIKYFEAELARVGAELRGREDSLTNYYVRNRVINYDKQTEQVAALDRDYELRYQDVQSIYSSSKAALENLDEGIKENLKAIKSNTEFLSHLNKISNLDYSIARIQTTGVDSIAGTNKVRTNYMSQLKRRLAQEEQNLKNFTEQYSSQKYTKDGYPTSNFVSQWVDELITLKKAEAEQNVLMRFKEDLDQQYSHFSPIGSTIKRQERSINFSENTYLSILSSLNAARLRLKSLEMNSASLRVINSPTFPLGSKPTKRMSYVMIAAFGSFFFILGFFLIVELLDRRLRNKFRTEKITTGKVIGAFPSNENFKHKKYISQTKEIATHYLANQLYGYFKTDNEKQCIINLLSISKNANVENIATNLNNYWNKINIKVKKVESKTDFQPSDREFLFAKTLSELVSIENNDIIIVKHIPLMEGSIPTPLLREATVNLLILQADGVWTEADQILFNELTKQADQSPVVICLSEAEQSSIEDFTGMLPPYSPFRKFVYRFFQLGLTSSVDA